MKKTVDQAWFDQNWFSGLKPQFKLAWMYIWTKSDLVGAWEPNFALANFQLGHEIKWEEFRKDLGDRVKVLENGKWWFPEYCRFQFGNFSEKSRVHMAALRILWSHGITQKDTLWIPYPYPMDTLLVISHSQSPEEEVKEKKPKRAVTPLHSEEDLQAARGLVNGLYNRRPTTKWSDKEEEALRKAMPILPEDIACISEYYAAEKKKEGGWYRRDALTFLNNYTGEVDRARQFGSKRKPACTV